MADVHVTRFDHAGTCHALLECASCGPLGVTTIEGPPDAAVLYVAMLARTHNLSEHSDVPA